MFNNRNVPDWGNYFLGIAESVAKRASCYRAHVGCVIVKNKRILSTGYNGSPSGREDCYTKGYCLREQQSIPSGTRNDECYAAGAHAEINAIVNAAKHGVSIEGATIYLCGHDMVCSLCQAAILNAGIYKVVIRQRSGRKLFLYPAEDFSTHPILDSGGK